MVLASRAVNAPAAETRPGKGRKVLAVVGGCLVLLLGSCCCLAAAGGYVAYLDNRSPYTPGDEISRTPFTAGTPFEVTAAFDGSGYAFVQLWAEVELAGAAPEPEIFGEVTCERGATARPRYVIWDQNARVFDLERTGDRVTAKILVDDEYMRGGERPQRCSVGLGVENATLVRGELVVRTYQRPSDRF